MWTAGLPLHAQCCGHPLDTSVLSATDADGHFSHATRPIATPCRAVRPNLPTLHTQRGHSTSSSPDAEHPCTLSLSQRHRVVRVAWMHLAGTVGPTSRLCRFFTWPALLLRFWWSTSGHHAIIHPLWGPAFYGSMIICPWGQHFDMSTVNFQLGLSLMMPSSLSSRTAGYAVVLDLGQSRKAFPCTPRQRSSVNLAELPLPVLPAPDHRPWETIEVCTDGSFDGGRSSWAFLVIGWHRGACHVIGWCAGPVVTDSTAVMHIGAGSHDAFRGELSALFWALAWLAQGAMRTCVQIWSDCFVALQQTNGDVGSTRRTPSRIIPEPCTRPFKHLMFTCCRCGMSGRILDIPPTNVLMPWQSGPAVHSPPDRCRHRCMCAGGPVGASRLVVADC